MSSDLTWEMFAREDPYWAVLTAEEYKTANLTDERRAAFLRTGEEHIRQVVDRLRARFGAPERFAASLDFGCGVGRLLLPLARVSDVAVGVDASDTMLGICAKNAAEAGLRNVELVLGDDTLSRLDRAVTLVTSFIVFQHIPPERGYRLFDRLLQAITPGGFGYVHFTYANVIRHIAGESHNPGVKYGYYMREESGIRRLVARPSPTDRAMEMNQYHLNELFCQMHDHGVRRTECVQTDHGGALGVEMYFQKST